MKKQLCLLIVVIVTIIFGSIYAVGQQVLRMNANDPQIQLAQDTAAQLNHGTLPASTSNRIDMAKSLSSFIIVYDKQGNPLTGNGYLNNSLAKAPIGMLQASSSKAYNAVTWQPSDGVRIASVTVKTGQYYVLSGRSLTEVEKRESQVLALSGLGWLLSIATVGAGYVWLKQSGYKH